jgi:hypothetical protein
MPTDPLRDLCPRSVVVWRNDAARCSTCGRMVNRATAGHPWRHARIVEAYIESELERLLRERIVDELDRLIDPAEPTHPLELKVLGRLGDDEVLAPDAKVTVAPNAGVYLGAGPERVRIGDLTTARAVDGALEVIADVNLTTITDTEEL